MAEIKYQCEFYSNNGSRYRMNLYHVDYSGTTIPFLAGPEGFQLTYEGNTDSVYQTIKASLLQFDFIVEDAAHVSDATQMALGSLFPYLKSGGMYIIEDISTAIRRTYGKINAWLKDGHGLVNDGAKENGHYCVNSLGIYHKQEFHIHDTLKGFTETGKWNSKLLNDKEKQYLSDNISKWDLPHRNLILIHKK